MPTSSGTWTLPWWAVVLLIAASPILVGFVVVALLLRLVAYAGLHCAAWCWWNTRGLDVLFVYSNSPVWQDHIESRMLPLIRSRAVVLNWSDRRRWRPGLASAVFGFFGGQREFNPLAVVFRPFRPARVFRFWQPFKAWKHGDRQALHRMETEFLEALGIRVTAA